MRLIIAYLAFLCSFLIAQSSLNVTSVTDNNSDYSLDQNMSINKIASLVKKTVEKKMGQKIKIIRTKSNDLRSYHINSDKIYKLLGFKPKRNIEQAVIEVYNALKSVLK